MNLKEIQDLIKFVAKADVTEVEIERKDFKITIKSEKEQQEQTVYVQQPTAPIAAPAPATPAPAAATPAAPTADAGSDNYVTITSPMIGTFYRKSSPDTPSFVEVGDSIKPGDVICIVEAMKLFNEIEAEISGTIVKVLVDDSQPVEYDQPLFLVDPA